MRLPRPPLDLLALAAPLAALGLAAIGLLASGCANVPKGGASEVHVSFGVPSVFHVKQDLAGVKATDRTIRAESSSTEVDILLFVWRSSAKDVVLSKSSPAKAEDGK